MKKKKSKLGTVIDIITMLCMFAVIVGMITGFLEYGVIDLAILCIINEFLNWLIKPIIIKIYKH